MGNIVLENDQIRILLSETKPIIFASHFKANNAYLCGETQNTEPIFCICQGLDILMPNRFKVSYNVFRQAEKVSYAASVISDNIGIASLDIIFRLVNDTVSIEIKNVIETDGFHLMNVELSALVSVKASESIAKIALPADCGRLIDVAAASCQTFRYEIDWVSPTLVGIAYNKSVIAILETNSYENSIKCEIGRISEEKYGELSMQFVHRLLGFDLADYGYKIPASNMRYHLKVQDSCKINLILCENKNNNRDLAWLDASKKIRSKINTVANPLYQDKLISKIALDLPDSEDKISFEEALSYIKTIALLTNNQPQVVYLVGWQYGGHDTGYPSVEKVNEKLGGCGSMLKLIEKAKEYNALVSFHDNYDDAYMSSPDWDSSLISQDSQGNLMKSGNFGAGQAYLLSNDKYAKERGVKRVQSTLKQYPISKTYHIDVLAGGFKGGRRYDFNPESPAAALRNLQGKLRIVDEFKKHGIDVTTEDFSSLFIGHISHFWHLNFFDRVFFRNEEVIPLIPAIYHDKASYGHTCNSKIDVLYALLHGAAFSCDINKAEFLKQTGYYFLVTLPWIKLYGKKIQRYSKEASKECVFYSDDSYVEIDFKSLWYTVKANGEIISQNYTVFFQSAENTYIGFSLEETLYRYRLPSHVDEHCTVVAYRQYTDGTSIRINVNIEDNSFSFKAEASSFYKLTFK